MWEADPVEYVRASVDEYENFSSLTSTPAQRFGTFTMMSVLGLFIVHHLDVKGSIKQFVVQYVLPDFTSQEPYLRSVLTRFKHNFNNHSRAVVLALDDRELPVRVQAVLAITELVVIHDSVRDAVSPQDGKVVQDLLKLSHETDLDILNHSMKTMVDRFQNELLPVASQLTA
ncbi:hypothetical protein DEU56DRAFT_754477 [Suillus clintonianus]|uniref:uncharacterized protein n=1 Tax=Suillus clintonianus TaxID=1904413 RepID=UPI001B88570D|nr:uncharacterized protein DEU56DRAFT_754477 [Suillus clintonianus]KAG2143678.1 hypothetical protein DEU56DRAFT_754477 [Suillus clintonianus]